MKAINILTILLLLFALTSCEKDNKTPVTTEDLSKYEVFDVHVQKFSDKSPMKNYYLSFFKTTWDQSGRSYKDSFIYSSKTNLDGNGSFKVPKELIKDSGNIFYYVSSHLNDSLNGGGYSGGVLVYNAGRTNNNLIEVNTLCGINFNSISSIWDSIKIDYIAIHHKNYNPKNLYNQSQTVKLEADCANSNTITYYYYSNGVKSKEYTKEIYVPYSSQGSNSVICTLDFK